MAPKGNRGPGTATSSSRKGIRKERAPIEPQEVEIVRKESSSSSSDQDHPTTAREATPITVHGQKYFKAEDLATTRKGYEIVHVDRRSKHYYCCLCLDEKKDTAYKPLIINGISSIHSHFRSKHNIDQSGKVIERESSARVSMASSGLEEFIFQSTLDKFKLLLIQWIIFCHISFLQIENKYFHNLLTFLSTALGSFLPSRNTFCCWVLEEFKIRKLRLRKTLRKARSKIHLSFNLWTSPNFYSIIAIVAHFIDSKGHRQTKLLAIRQLKGEHSGENIAASVLQVIREYRIQRHIGFFVLDNASSNDVAVDYILHSLYPQMSEEARKRRRLRCLAHVTNLVAQAFLLGWKAEDVADELHVAQLHADFGRTANIWRKHSALERLHNIIRYIRLSPQRCQEFRNCEENTESWKEFNKLEV